MIVTDYQLRNNETGLDVAFKVQTTLAKTFPILVLTGNSHPDAIKHFKETNVPVLYKPVNAEQLRDMLNQLLY